MHPKRRQRVADYVREKGGITESAEGSIQKALANNCRFGFVAGGLDDRGLYSTFFESSQVQYPPGIQRSLPQSIHVHRLQRHYTIAAVMQRRRKDDCGFNVSGVPMGGETTTALKPGLKVNRHIFGICCRVCSGTYRGNRQKRQSNQDFSVGYILAEFHLRRYDTREKGCDQRKDQEASICLLLHPFHTRRWAYSMDSPIWVDYIANAPTRGLVKRAPPKINLS